LNSLTGPDGDQHAWSAYTALLIGTTLSLLAYLTVVAAVARVLADLDAGQPVSLGGIFRAVVRHARSLVAVVALLVVVVGLLLVPVVTVPLALLVLVRYGFAVQAVLVEHRGPVSALRRSRELVHGQWWRAALLAALVGGIGGGAGPGGGVGLLVVASASLRGHHMVG